MSHIPYEKRAEVYREALRANGKDTQLIVALEEMSEAQQTICKAIRGIESKERIAEEVADAWIGLEQVVRIFGIKEAVADMMDNKILRLEERLHAAKASGCTSTELRCLRDLIDDREESGLWTDFP